ncbi:D-2-hydroxyacid dehydrogenase [Halopiger aswanensis]|uniref:D-2-hydroxyacid dehydrogenase (NADP+) n=1 Tax=Halopiger aswanensis TaxID=148449 RepID=A0A3R7EBU8_9EURY|nr:D-2-hydroxyacid dehydrogenase [Halopiger aswanensis]RKD88018.1 D-2-hydroxyacid dehydrogenase (NADP+) [Halopiger aswanensis]
MGRPDLDQLYVHESVENVIPKEAFVDAFDDLSIPTALVGDGHEFGRTDAIATYVPRPEFLDAGWVHCIRAGYDEFDTEAYEDAGVRLTNSTGIHGSTVGELALSFMLSLARLDHRYRDHQNQRTWWEPPYDRPFTIENERACVVGLGTIGKAIATRCDAMGMEVVGVRRSDEPVPGVSDIFSPDELHEAIEDARFVVLTVPHTPETDGMLSDEEFELMRDDAYVINVARGPIVDEDALVDALEDDEIAGAGLDVFETEPLPEASPLWDFDEVIISPHKASATNRYHLDLADLVMENVHRYQSGDLLKNRVA